jgi:adenosylcobyric acid synthase
LTAALMIQGTGSDVGKTVMVAGLCRALVRRGIRVAPFKPQNMSNNAAVADGGEIGRAQALQARAARIAPSVHMNPVLLKPESDTGSQVIVQGRRLGSMRGEEYRRRRAEFLPRAMESYARLTRDADLVLVEGAGSPAEANLRAGDIANMGFAEAADIPVVIVGDIDRGGVIASLVGTHAVISPAERERVRGFLINKFRGDRQLFADGVRLIEERSQWPCLGVVPWLDALQALPAEDSVGLHRRPTTRPAALTVAVPALPRIANFDDLDPLRLEPAVRVVIVRRGEPIPAAVDLVILPGSKATIADLAALRAEGWDVDILAHRRRGGRVLGICGGYQMLGMTIADPDGVEGAPGRVRGLGLLAVDTVLAADKATVAVTGRHLASGEDITGYEIHMGRTSGADSTRPLLDLAGRPDGAQSADGLVAGTYVHGLFAADGFRRAYLAGLGATSSIAYETAVEGALDALADHLDAHVAVDRLLAIAGYTKSTARPASATTLTKIAAAPR